VECLRDHTPLAQCGGVVVPLMSEDYDYEHNIPNAWFGSVPGHPFWISMLSNINIQRSIVEGVEFITGPMQLFYSLERYEKLADGTLNAPVHYVNSGLIFPYDWHEFHLNTGRAYSHLCSAQAGSFDSDECKKMLGTDKLGSYTITYWSHSWDDKDSLKNLHNPY
jgi:inositol phosphorylceramide mannosyltransferase catalytic subunit